MHGTFLSNELATFWIYKHWAFCSNEPATILSNEHVAFWKILNNEDETFWVNEYERLLFVYEEEYWSYKHGIFWSSERGAF